MKTNRFYNIIKIFRLKIPVLHGLQSLGRLYMGEVSHGGSCWSRYQCRSIYCFRDITLMPETQPRGCLIPR